MKEWEKLEAEDDWKRDNRGHKRCGLFFNEYQITINPTNQGELPFDVRSFFLECIISLLLVVYSWFYLLPFWLNSMKRPKKSSTPL